MELDKTPFFEEVLETFGACLPLKKHGFMVRRVKSLATIDSAGQREAEQRGQDFAHLDMGGQELSFNHEIARLKAKLVCY